MEDTQKKEKTLEDSGMTGNNKIEQWWNLPGLLKRVLEDTIQRRRGKSGLAVARNVEDIQYSIAAILIRNGAEKKNSPGH